MEQVARLAATMELLEGTGRVLMDDAEGLMADELMEVGRPTLALAGEAADLAEKIRRIGERRD